MQLKFISTEVTFRHPLDENSNPILPVPANNSNNLISWKLILLAKTLNSPSFAKDVVGLTGNFFGAIIF